MTAAASADAMPAMPSRTSPIISPLVNDTYVAESLDPSVIVYLWGWAEAEALKARVKGESLVNSPF